MFTFKKRGEHSHWNNESAITDLHEGLHVLNLEAGHKTHRDPLYLRKITIDGTEFWEVVFPWYREGSSGGDTQGQDYYLFDTALAERLIKEHFVRPFKEVGWGYTRDDPTKLVLTGTGQEELKRFIRSMEEVAKALLTPGIHTDLTGETRQYDCDREGYHCGRLYVDFRDPNDSIVRVYPETKEIVAPYPPQKAA